LWPPENKNFQFLSVSLAHPPPNGKGCENILQEYFLAIDCELAYNELFNRVAESLQGL
jgi:hypothetical protein